MKLEIWQCPLNQTAGGFRGYHPELSYEKVWESHVDEVVDRYTSDVEDALDLIFQRFQRVDEETRWPPEGYAGRSLTSGDLVCLDEYWYFCAPVGWTKVSPPTSLGTQRKENA